MKQQIVSYHGLVAYRGKDLVENARALYERALAATQNDGVCYATRPIGTVGLKTVGDHLAAFEKDCWSTIHPVFGRCVVDREDEPYGWFVDCVGDMEFIYTTEEDELGYVYDVTVRRPKLDADPVPAQEIVDLFYVNNRMGGYLELWSAAHQKIHSVWVKSYASVGEKKVAERLAKMLDVQLEIVDGWAETDYEPEIYDPYAGWVADEGVEGLMAASRSRFCIEWE